MRNRPVNIGDKNRSDACAEATHLEPGEGPLDDPSSGQELPWAVSALDDLELPAADVLKGALEFRSR